MEGSGRHLPENLILSSNTDLKHCALLEQDMPALHHPTHTLEATCVIIRMQTYLYRGSCSDCNTYMGRRNVKLAACLYLPRQADPRKRIGTMGNSWKEGRRCRARLWRWGPFREKRKLHGRWSFQHKSPGSLGQDTHTPKTFRRNVIHHYHTT